MQSDRGDTNNTQTQWRLNWRTPHHVGTSSHVTKRAPWSLGWSPLPAECASWREALALESRGNKDECRVVFLCAHPVIAAIGPLGRACCDKSRKHPALAFSLGFSLTLFLSPGLCHPLSPELRLSAYCYLSRVSGCLKMLSESSCKTRGLKTHFHWGPRRHQVYLLCHFVKKTKDKNSSFFFNTVFFFMCICIEAKIDKSVLFCIVAFKKPPLNIIKDYKLNCELFYSFIPLLLFSPGLRLFVGVFQLTLLGKAWNVVGVTVWVTLKQHVLSFNAISQLSRFHLSQKMTWPARFWPWVWHTWCTVSVSSWPSGFWVFVSPCYYKEKLSTTSGFFRPQLIVSNHLDGFCIWVTTTFWTAGHKSLPL